MFFVWFSANINVLGYVRYLPRSIPIITLLNYSSFGTGSVGPAFFGLGLKQSLLVLLVVDLM